MLELVVPAIEVDMEHDEAPSAEARDEESLVVAEGQGFDGGLAGREGVERGQGEGPPYLHNTCEKKVWNRFKIIENWKS